MSESIGLYGIPVDFALGLFSLTAMVNPLEKVNTHVTVPRWRNGGWAHPPRDSRTKKPANDPNIPRNRAWYIARKHDRDRVTVAWQRCAMPGFAAQMRVFFTFSAQTSNT